MELTTDTSLPVEPIVGQIEPAEITTRTALTYSSGNIGGGIFSALNLYALPTLLDPLLKGIPFGLVLNNILSSTHSFEGTVIQPLVGAWSDRSWHPRWGRRRVFIVRFLPISALLIALTPFIPLFGHLANTTTILLVSASIFLFSVTFNILNDPYSALLPDITPQRQRGQVNGIFQAVGAAGQVLFLIASIALGIFFQGAATAPLFIIAALAIAASFLPTLLGIREPRELAGTHKNHRYSVRDYWNGLRRDPQVARYFAIQFLLWIGINAISVNITLYAHKVLGLSVGLSAILPLVLLLSTALTYLPLIKLVKRIGLKQLYICGVVLMAVASVGAIFTHSVLFTCLLLVVAGIGNAAQTVSSYPLLTRIVFPDQMGLYTGLNTAVTSISAPISAIIAGSLITIYSFNALFPFLGVMFLLSIIPLVFLNVEQSHAAQSLRAAEAHGQP